MRFLELGRDVFVLQAELGMGRGSQKWKNRHVQLGDKWKISFVGFTIGKSCPGTSHAPTHYFPSFPKTWLPGSGFGSRHGLKAFCTRYPGKPNLRGLGRR